MPAPVLDRRVGPKGRPHVSRIYSNIKAFAYPDHVRALSERRVVAPVAVLDDAAAGRERLPGSIVLVPQADPGFDWVFGHEIAGLVTMYGGANSHMAIRAAQFGLPAAIGVGEDLYELLSRAEVILLDCGARTIQVIR